MKIEIKHIFTNNVLSACEADNLRDAVLEAVREGAYLRGADLRGAYLTGADLTGAYLRGEKIAITPISILNLTWDILISESYLVIGCQRHTHDEWANFSDDEIKSMELRALEFWADNKAWILSACESHKKQSLEYRAKHMSEVTA